MFGRNRAVESAEADIKGRAGADDDTERIRSENKAKLELIRIIHEKEKARRDLPNWEPKVEVKNYASGKFMRVAAHEIPIAHIASVDVEDVGGDPWVRDPMFFENEFRAIENKAVISINMASGIFYTVGCWDFQVDVMKGRIEQAWKEGK